MNFRKLLTYLTVGTAAVIPFAGAQNPTILQGSYISNVFGNSNFVKNPNAQTNVANVTNATRSTTTPLVATSEFNLSLDAGQNATWTLRTFDAGMKGQNCEARFSYRGFATATTTAEIVQNSLVVAQLVLTPSTDPRIASINFPCGDLANATTFRIAQTTANMTGTNEIGGVYTGLATNQANVAQAEFVGSVRFGTNCSWAITSSTYSSPIDTTCSTTAIGNVAANTVANTKPSIVVNDTRPGNYYAVWSGASFQKNSVVSYQYCSIRITDSITPVGGYVDPTNLANFQVFSLSQNFQYSTNGTKTFSIEMKSSDNTTACILNTSTDEAQFSVYRFPTSSELVVTPERQNTYGGVSAYGGGATAVTAAAWTNLNNSGAVTRSFYGKASAPSTAGDVAIKIASMPVGTYSVTFTGQAYALSAASAETQCFFGITDGTSRPAVTAISAVGDATTAIQGIAASSFSSIFTNTAVQDKTFTVQAYRGGGTGSCNLYADVNRPYLITVTPLDQPSNSALYVEGPVKASATGAAIPAGYQGQVITTASAIATTTATLSETDVTNASFTLTPGVWQIFYSVTANYSSGTTSGNDGFTMVTITDSANTHIGASERIIYAITRTAAANQNYSSLAASAVVNVTGSTVYKLRLKRTDNGGIGSGAVENVSGAYGSTFYAIRIN
jgi:hypothetical protein